MLQVSDFGLDESDGVAGPLRDYGGLGRVEEDPVRFAALNDYRTDHGCDHHPS